MELGGLNEFFRENRGWIEIPRAMTRGRSRNKSTGQSEWAGNSGPSAESFASRRAIAVGQARGCRPVGAEAESKAGSKVRDSRWRRQGG